MTLDQKLPITAALAAMVRRGDFARSSEPAPAGEVATPEASTLDAPILETDETDGV